MSIDRLIDWLSQKLFLVQLKWCNKKSEEFNDNFLKWPNKKSNIKSELQNKAAEGYETVWNSLSSQHSRIKRSIDCLIGNKGWCTYAEALRLRRVGVGLGSRKCTPSRCSIAPLMPLASWWRKWSCRCWLPAACSSNLSPPSAAFSAASVSAALVFDVILARVIFPDWKSHLKSTQINRNKIPD